ncbi:MAG: DedA family protein [Rhodospirillales bacterium]|nr:DedA family protein [Rhodospirillales bacterium]
MAIESACIPLPSELIMPFAGYLVASGRFDLIAVATAGAIGCNLGSIPPFEIGARGGRKAVERWGRYVLLSHDDLDRADRFFARFGAITVLVCRLLPVVRTFIALPAGIARMNRLRFHAYTFLGSWPWCFALAYVGMKLGRAWDHDPRLQAVMHRLDLLVLAALVLGVAWFLRRHWRARARP